MTDDHLPIPVGWTLVPDQAAKPPAREWTYAIPVFDPGNDLERAWSRVMRWPRRAALAFLYLTQSWRHAAAALAVAVLVVVLLMGALR